MATASAGRATRVRRRLPRVPRALAARRSRGFGAGQGRRQAHGRQPSSCAQTRGVDMTRHDPEIEELREKVHCAVVLEQTPPCWKLDRKESTKLSLKYRRGKGEILIVSHAGRGWWDPTSDAKGDVFRLVQRLEPGLSFGHVRKRLRAFAGLSPVFRRPIGQGAERSRTEPSLPAGPSEGRFGRTLRPGAISNDSAGCRQRSLRRRPWPAFCGRVPSAAPGSPISIATAPSRTSMSEARLTKVR